MGWFAKLLNRIPHETIKIDGKPYLTRYFLTGKNTRETGERPHLFLHHFHMSDQDRELHDHPYTGLSLILRGGYVEERKSVIRLDLALAQDASNVTKSVVQVPVYSEVRVKTFLPGMLNRLRLGDFHRTVLIDEENGAWTLFLTGRRKTDWGFLDRDTEAFYPYEGRNGGRLGRGAHVRAEGDKATAVRRQKHEGSY
jgi:hypothetical protein